MVSLGLKLPKQKRSPGWTFELSAGEWGERAESLGYDSIWTTEGWGGNAFVDLAEVAVHTDRLRFGTAITNVYSRSPAVLAMGAGSLARLSGGRVLLGLGASHPGFVEELHNVDYERPVRRSHEAIELIRALLEGEDPVEYEGELFSVEGFTPLDQHVPIYNAAMGEANCRATGRVADGWIPFLLPFSMLDRAFETVATAASEVGRDPEDITVVPQVLSVVDDDPEAARDPIRTFVATYVGRFEAYRSTIADRFPDETAEIAAAWETDGEEAAKQLVSEGMLKELGVAGTPDSAREQLREILEIDAVDGAMVYVPTGSSHETIERTMEELAPERL